MANELIMRMSSPLRGSINVPGDKSISHRALLFGALASGVTTVTGFLASEDTRATADCLRLLGVEIIDGEILRINGVGLRGFRSPASVLWTGNSGTTTRLMMGILAGQPFTIEIDGDNSLQKRPMDRVAIPLRKMGAKISGIGDRCTLPLQINGGNLQSIDYFSPVASAQVKSAILLAGLYATGTTSVCEPMKSRDHTERMLRGFGVQLQEDGLSVAIKGGQKLTAQNITVPGDISSAAFFLVAGAVTPGSQLTIRNVGINPTRSGVIEVLQAMGANLHTSELLEESGEQIADLTISYCPLQGTVIAGELIPRLIDELPILAVAAAFAAGDTIIRDAKELRVKESDRIVAVCELLRKMGGHVEELPDGMIIHGGLPLHQATIDSNGDHRMAMSALIAAVATGVNSTVTGADTIATSFPTFVTLLRSLGVNIEEC